MPYAVGHVRMSDFIADEFHFPGKMIPEIMGKYIFRNIFFILNSAERVTFHHCITKLNHATHAQMCKMCVDVYSGSNWRLRLPSFSFVLSGFMQYDIKLKDFCKHYVSVCITFPSHLSDNALIRRSCGNKCE